MPERDEQSTHRLEHWVHWTLLAGLSVSALLLLGGLLATLLAPRDSFTPPPNRSRPPLHLPITGTPPATLLDLGLLVLLATPVLRVAALAAGWTITREYRFALVALTVLSLLGVSLLLGFG